MNPVEGKVVIDVSRKYVSIFRCTATGEIIDYDHFSFPHRLEHKEAVSQTVDVYSIIYDWLNRGLNGGSASEASESPHS